MQIYYLGYGDTVGQTMAFQGVMKLEVDLINKDEIQNQQPAGDLPSGKRLHSYGKSHF